MLNIFVTVETSQLEISPLNTEAERNIHCIFVTLETSQEDIFPLKFVAPLKIYSIFITLETSQLDRSSLNSLLPLNKFDISVINETSQVLISPYVVSALALSSTHKSTAVWSSSFVWGWKTTGSELQVSDQS